MKSGRGFTLIELMVVVLIMGILATLATTSFRSELSRSKATEGLSVARAISMAQESYRAMHHRYLDACVGRPAVGLFYPSGSPGWDTTNTNRAKITFYGHSASHADAALWEELSVNVNQLIEFRYRTRAGLPGQTPFALQSPASVTWPTTNKDWYVVEALGDVDGDGDQSLIVLTSFNGQVARYNYGD